MADKLGYAFTWLTADNALDVGEGQKKTIEQFSEELVQKAVESRTNAITAAKEELQAEINKKIDADKIWRDGSFSTITTQVNGSHAQAWVEFDGGGIEYLNTVSKVRSFIGVEDANGKNNGDITAEISAVDDISKVGTHINVNQLGAYYLAGTTNEGTPTGREIAVKDDVADVEQELQNLFDEVRNDYLTTENAEATYAKQENTYTKAEVDELVAKAVNEAIATVLATITSEFE